jgi:peptide/nickel transport system substrate-binding protein
MNIGVTQKPDSFNPFAMTLSISYQINFLLYDTLNSVEPDLTPGPQMATSWESNDDGTIWTYHIVEGATWHDDVPLTANDVNFTFNLIKDNPDECALFGNYLQGFTEIVALDDYTIRITTDQPKATMLSLMVPILPEHLWGAVPVDKLSDVDPWDTEYFEDGPVGSGPLILDYYDQTRGEISMLKWARYYIDVVNVDEALYLIFSFEDAMMTALYAGDIDIASGVPARVWNTTLAKDDIEG